MAWRIAGTYFESCSCDAPCPCRRIDGKPGGRSTHGFCQGALSWRIERGRAETTDLSDLAVAVTSYYSDDEAGSPWTFRLFLDERADDQQRAALERIFTGAEGGDALEHFPWAWKRSNLAGVVPARIEVDHTPRRQFLRIRDEVLVQIRTAFEEDTTITCVIPGHHQPGEELVAERLQVATQTPLAFDYQGVCGYAAAFDYRGQVMFDHVTIRVSDLAASRSFYGLAMSTLGFGEPETDGHFFEWWDFSISTAREDRPLTRNLHLALVTSSRKDVDEWWRALTDAGYEDDGAPGPRPEYHADYYGGFVLDPDGNSVEAVSHGRLRKGENHIDHLWIRVADLQASQRFYETIAPVVGVRIDGVRPERFHVVGGHRSFALVQDARALTANVHIAFPAEDNAKVEEFHRVAIAAGYRDNGPPGERRYHPGYYGAFVLDPDGNNIEAVCHNR